jgi:hypothetical protein
MDRPRIPDEYRGDSGASETFGRTSSGPVTEPPFDDGETWFEPVEPDASDASDADEERPADSDVEPSPPPCPPEIWASATVQQLVWADRFARDLRDASERLTVPLALVARTVVEQRIWTVFGHARAEDYCRERLDNTARWVRELARLGRGFDRLPGLERAIGDDDGGPRLGRTHAIEIAKVASPESVATWIRLAPLFGCRDFAQIVRDARRAKTAWPFDSNGADPAMPTVSLEPMVVDERAPRCEVRLPVPGPLRVAFDEVRQLHGAVSGGDVPVADFVESLVAEAMTGPVPVDVDRVPLEKTQTAETIERDLSRKNDEWGWLDSIEVPAPAAIHRRDRIFDKLHEGTVTLLRELEEASVDPHTGTPADLDRRIRQLLALKDRIDRQLGRALSYMGDKHAWLRLHFDSVEHYAAERLCMQRRSARDRARAAKVTKRLPLLREAYESGALGLQKTLLVARALGPFLTSRAIERAWVEHARQVSVQRMRDEVRIAEREWLEHGSWAPRPPLSDKEWWDSLTLHPGTTQRRFERLVGVAGSAAQRDTFTQLMLRLPEPLANDFLAAVESRCSQLLQAWITRSVDASNEDVLLPLAMRTAAAFLSRGLVLPSWVGLLALLEEYLATWDPAKAPRRTRHGAIFGRDGYRCAAPMCTGQRNLDGHHVEPQSQGGGDEPDNLISLCRFHHHRGAHGELGACTGKAPLRLLWRLGRQDVAEWYRNERQVASPLDLLATAS